MKAVVSQGKCRRKMWNGVLGAFFDADMKYLAARRVV
jgi:hypothetical protein